MFSNVLVRSTIEAFLFLSIPHFGTHIEEDIKFTTMAFLYQNFHGKYNEDIKAFLEQFEVAIINNHVVEEARIMHLLKIFLKDEACRWFMKLETIEVVVGC